MQAVAIQMRQLSRKLRVMYDNNDFYIQDMGEEVTEAYMALQERLAILNRKYVSVYRKVFQGVSTSLKEMASYPLGQRYTEMVQEASIWLEDSLAQSMSSLSE